MHWTSPRRAAETGWLSKDLHFKPNQYKLLLSIFFVPYVISASPLAMLGKWFGPARVLPILMFTFGSFTLLSTSVYNIGALVYKGRRTCEKSSDISRHSCLQKTTLLRPRLSGSSRVWLPTSVSRVRIPAKLSFEQEDVC